jgi:hypothetical protein
MWTERKRKEEKEKRGRWSESERERQRERKTERLCRPLGRCVSLFASNPRKCHPSPLRLVPQLWVRLLEPGLVLNTKLDGWGRGGNYRGLLANKDTRRPRGLR